MSVEALKVTVAVRAVGQPDAAIVAAEVFAQYVKLSDVAVVPVGVYVKVPFAQIPGTGFCGCALQVSVPLAGGVSSVTP